MKFRRHHNNTGLRQIKNGATQRDAEAFGSKLGVPVQPKKNALKRLVERAYRPEKSDPGAS